MDVYMTDADGNDDQRMVLDVDEQIRIAALNAAIAYGKAGNMATLEMYADAFKEYIFEGEMPKAPTGVIW